MNKIALITLSLAVCVASAGATPVGGLGEERPADEHVKNIVSSMKGHIQAKVPGDVASITAVSYKEQVVAGLNYFIKAIVTEKNGNKSHVHLRIFEPFRGSNQLTSIKTDVDESSPLNYF